VSQPTQLACYLRFLTPLRSVRNDMHTHNEQHRFGLQLFRESVNELPDIYNSRAGGNPSSSTISGLKVQHRNWCGGCSIHSGLLDSGLCRSICVRSQVTAPVAQVCNLRLCAVIHAEEGVHLPVHVFAEEEKRRGTSPRATGAVEAASAGHGMSAASTFQCQKCVLPNAVIPAQAGIHLLILCLGSKSQSGD
jgi:hypothetical protein